MAQDFEIAFVGAGQMGSALIRGLVRAGFCEPGRILAAEPRQEVLRPLLVELGIQAASSTAEVGQKSSTVVLAVKPQDVPRALEELAPALGSEHLLLSVAAGVPLRFLQTRLSPGVRLIRAMPNTPCLLGMGCSALAPGSHATAQDMNRARAVFKAVGEVVELREELMDAVTGLSGSGPAYLFLFAEALVEAGVRMGIPWSAARTLVFQTLRGASEMLIASSEHPARLREQVSSPGGTTLAGLAALEKGGFRGLLSQAVEEATQRGRELGRELK
jgi:pyrroline-5-carboxylate reductase